jgi:AraC-like DNA-binding protein
MRNRLPVLIVAAQLYGANAQFPSFIALCFAEATRPGRRLTLSRGHSLLLTLADLSSSGLSCPNIPALLGASLTFLLEGTAVSRRPTGTLSAIENEIIREIRALRATPGEGIHASLLENPARSARHFILDSHGNVQLRLATIARELGVEMRTLERIFFEEFCQTMVECQLETRLAFSMSLLSIFPVTKISAVAAILGYNVVQDFNRFFKKHLHESPSEWSRKERARIVSGEAGSSNE